LIQIFTCLSNQDSLFSQKTVPDTFFHLRMRADEIDADPRHQGGDIIPSFGLDRSRCKNFVQTVEAGGHTLFHARGDRPVADFL
jgi:hypothetical protein